MAPMMFLYLGLTLGTIGKIVLGVAVMRVHSRIAQEHKIDGAVVRAITREKYITGASILLIVLGYVLEMVFYATSTLTIS